MTKTYATRWLALAAVLSLVAAGCAKKEEVATPQPAEAPMVEPAEESMVAVAELAPRADTSVTGMVKFSQQGDSVSITAHIEGAPPGMHGFHIHEIGDCSSDDFKSAGGHFNPSDTVHGGPDNPDRHEGDLGNIEIGEDGSGHLELTSSLITVSEGPNSVVGRGVILHEKADDLVSQPTGAAGSRIACGVVAAQDG